MEKSDTIKSIIQYLNEKGFKEVGAKLEEESEILFESKQLKILRNSIKNEKFEESINLILKNCDRKDQLYLIPKLRILQIFITISKNFDPLREKNIINQNESLNLIRKICSSDKVYEKDNAIEKCSQLIFIHNKKELNEKMKEICFCASSKDRYFEYLENTLSSSKSLLKTLHPKSLENMMDCVIKQQIKTCVYHIENSTEEIITRKNCKPNKNSNLNNFSYFEDHKCKKENLPHDKILSIANHDVEISALILSTRGNFFAGILKNNFIVIYMFYRQNKYIEIRPISEIRAHESQITSLVWNSKETNILTASKDKFVKVFDIFTRECKLKINLNCMVSSAIYLDNEQRILASGLDNAPKLNLYTIGGNIMESVPTVTIDQIFYSKKLNIIILVAPTNKSILLYDYALKNELDKLNVNDTIVSSAISRLDDGEFLLVNSSTSTPVLSLWHLPTRTIKRKYFGHRQERLTTKCAFGGVKERFLISGSDGKEIYIWNREYTVPISVIKVHNGIVNSVIWPFSEELNVIVSGSDDHTIKIIGNKNIPAVYTEYDMAEGWNIKNLNLTHLYASDGNFMDEKNDLVSLGNNAVSSFPESSLYEDDSSINMFDIEENSEEN